MVGSIAGSLRPSKIRAVSSRYMSWMGWVRYRQSTAGICHRQSTVCASQGCSEADGNPCLVRRGHI